MTQSVANKKETAMRTFPAPLRFKNIITTAATNHPDYKNTTDFIIECLQYGFNEIQIELGEIDESEKMVLEQSGKLSNNITKELREFLKSNPVESLRSSTEDKKGISWNMDKEFFLQLKSKIPLSKYKELRNFYYHQIYNGLERML